MHTDPTVQTAPSGASPGWQGRFPALAYPNFRLWFVGQVIAAFGMWMQSTAQGYLIYELTHSPAYLGYVSLAYGLPTWLLMLYGGVVADRVPRRTLMLCTQSCMMILALVLAALTLLRLIQPWHILVLALLLGIANSFDAPARQSFILEMVERRDLANAVALSSTMFNLATTLGPAVAGFTYALVGPGWCFLLNGLSFTGVISMLIMLKLNPLPAATRRVSLASELKEGLGFVLRHSTVRVLLLLVSVISLFGMSFTTLFPAWAVQVLGGDATTNGLLQSARGAGAFLSALWIASLGRFSYKGKVITVASLIVPFTMIAFSQVRWLPLSLLLLVATGLAVMPVINLANALIQTLTPDHLRGRVMSIYSLVFFGLWPVGGMWAGALAQRIGEQTTVLLGGLIVLVSVVAIHTRSRRLRALE